MFCRNEINGLLKGSLKYPEGEGKIYYDISSRQSLFTLYERKNLGFNDVKNLFYSWAEAAAEAERYLLNTGYLVCRPEYIYLDPSTKKASWLFYPTDSEADYPADLCGLAEFLLEKTDHKDADAVDIVYKFYRDAKAGTFLLSEITEMIEAVKVRPGDAEEAYGHDEYIRDEFPVETGESKETGESSVFKRIGKLFSDRKTKRNGNEKEEGNPVLQTAETFEREGKQEQDYLLWQETEEEPETKETVIIAEKTEAVRELKCIRDGKTYSLKKLPAFLGKMKSEVDIFIEDDSVSRIHARFFESDGKVFIEDLNSTNGSAVNEIDLEAYEKVELYPKDRIRIGNVDFIYN